MKRYASPNGSPIIGTLETLTGRAELTWIEDDGTPEYEGGTEIFWEEQKTITREGKIVFLDDDGEEWTFDQLTAVLDEEVK